MLRAGAHVLGAPAFFPVGRSNFKRIRASGAFYVDHTRFLEVWERVGEDGYTTLLRPPRFGKTLMLDMMAAYYDAGVGADEHDRLFHGLYIGENPTSGARAHHVLRLNLAPSASVGASFDMQAFLDDAVDDALVDFVERYNLAVQRERPFEMRDIKRVVGAVGRAGGRVMVLIDEYDRVANELMVKDKDAYARSVMGVSGEEASSPLRSLLTTFKMAQDRAPVTLLMTGLTPIVLADVSAYNVARNLTLREEFGDFFGFTSGDIERGLTTAGHGSGDIAAALAVMRKWYNGYLFPGASQRVFNPQISLHFMDLFTSSARVKEATLRGVIAPDDLVSRNLRVTESMLSVLATSRAGAGPLAKLLGGDATYTLEGRVVDEFRFSDLMRWNLEGVESESEDKFCSYLYYHGALTFAEKPGMLPPDKLSIPNELVRREFWDALPKRLRDAVLKTLDAAFAAGPQASAELWEDIFSALNERSAAGIADTSRVDEHAFRGMLLWMTGNEAVSVQTEVAAPRQSSEGAGTGRVDLVVEHVKSPTRFVIELKRVKGSGPKALAGAVERAAEQVADYDLSAVPKAAHVTHDVRLAVVLADDDVVVRVVGDEE
ncbi:uncharacterized protein AMSG_12037 [Thecamonas trahens ATCC 50062]|uniref:AAA-ATPase-like domain-containing protein n=1 Tax=Thecamonas trahens ATCC 50062 TaxID=461836 RepID=A0A0L0DFJ3_THETB|nr:hypothetical protein AMSG_12037 [Thecamonas trahens ATCC 50062]KNC51087.1 hypothetical protein AMSG_12037 [Thecamonas trahens ATCC 50062]|eukprot:XP_013756568.1 hypothetical protein AMSG_12037 [Thecamonas trahens ATCC 50062]